MFWRILCTACLDFLKFILDSVGELYYHNAVLILWLDENNISYIVSICCFSNCSRCKHYGSFYLEKGFLASHDSQSLVCPSHCYPVLFFVHSFLNTLVISAACPAILSQGVLDTLLYKYKELYPTTLQRGEEYSNMDFGIRKVCLIRIAMEGMRSTDLSNLWPVLWHYSLTLSESFIRLENV